MVSDTEYDQLITVVEDLHKDSISFLQEMIRTPSVNPPGEYEAIHNLVKSQYESYGWDCETIQTPDRILEELGLNPDYPRKNLLAYVTRGEGPTIVLNAHFDTVPIDESEKWEYDPFGAQIDGDRIYGRGAIDSKGRIASYTLAARLLEEADLLPENATLILAITCDEETGGEAGPGYLVESDAINSDYAIVEGNCENIWTAVSGVRQFEVTVRGKASHAGLNPEAGSNAILGASRVLQSIEEYVQKLSTKKSKIDGISGPTCVPATIKGGVKTNVVPAECSFTVDHRVPPDYNSDEIEEHFTEIVDSVSLPKSVSSEMRVILKAEPYLSDPNDAHVQIVKKNAEKIFGREFPLVGIRGFSDRRFFAANGAKTINFGPGDSDSNPHGSDENISLNQVRDASIAVAASIIDLARI